MFSTFISIVAVLLLAAIVYLSVVLTIVNHKLKTIRKNSTPITHMRGRAIMRRDTQEFVKFKENLGWCTMQNPYFIGPDATMVDLKSHFSPQIAEYLDDCKVVEIDYTVNDIP